MNTDDSNHHKYHELYEGNTLVVNNTKNSYLPLLKETTDVAGEGLELIRLRLEGNKFDTYTISEYKV